LNADGLRDRTVFESHHVQAAVEQHGARAFAGR
jgi:hypothetical protein